MIKRRHHYLPKFYLENFIDPQNHPYIWIYEKGNTVIKKASAIDIAVKKDYYTFITISGRKDTDTYENLLAEIECKAAPVFQNIIKHENLDEKSKFNFAAFLAFTLIRVPYFRDKIRHLAKMVTKKRVQAIAADPDAFKSYVTKFNLQEVIKDQEQLRRSLQQGNHDIKISSYVSLEMMPQFAIDLISVFQEMHWYFLLSTNNMSFVTSDNPIVYFNQLPDAHFLSDKGFINGLKNKYTEISFPISSNIVFLGTWGRLTEYQSYSELNNCRIRDMKSMSHPLLKLDSDPLYHAT
jgi:hypothetical protein